MVLDLLEFFSSSSSSSFFFFFLVQIFLLGFSCFFVFASQSRVLGGG